MSTTHNIALRNAIRTAVITALGASAKLKFRIAGSTADAPSTSIATLTLTTALTATTDGVANTTNIASDTAATAGTAAFATIESADATMKIHCAVATTGSDVNISSGGLVFANGDTVTCSSLTYTVPV